MQKIRERLEIGCERNDEADVRIPIGPAVEPPADSARERIIHARVAQGALEADGAQTPAVIERAGYADDSAQLEQSDRQCRIVQVHATRPMSRFRCSGRASASTLKPAASAVFGLTAAPSHRSRRRRSLHAGAARPQNASEPNVS